MKVTESVELPKELNDIRIAIVALVKAVKEAGKDGFQVGTDIPAIVMAAYKPLADAINGASSIPAEMKESLSGSIKVAGLMGADIVEALK